MLIIEKKYPNLTGVAQHILPLIMASPDFQSIFLRLPPEKGWTGEVLTKKVENLTKVIKSMHNGESPDLIGLELKTKEY
ncbi:MAG: hypothetical protein H0W19_09220 [Nitrosopumilus sp.]|nr:hypothetical protein [Nitrosopumilus sp.]